MLMRHVQEHRLSRTRYAQVVEQLRKAGWNADGRPAVLTNMGRYFACVMIPVEQCLDTWAPDEGDLARGRDAGCHLRLKDLGQLTFMTCDLWVGEGFTPRNMKLIQIIGQEVQT
eukprot:3505214-Pyramimonas_sp.AAC.1